MSGMPTPELVVTQDGPVLTVTFNRPGQRNAMTFAMYDGLFAACERADSDDGVRVLVLRGAGDKAFVSGTDIAQFAEFRDGADGVAYEARITRVINRLEDVTVPTVAAVRGFCVGAGLAIAAACDLRVVTRSARFGVPIARTVGNCLSMNTYSLLLFHLGPARTLDLLLRARLLSADDAHGAGFVSELCADDALDGAVDELVAPLLEHAPLTMWAAKQATVRFRRAGLPDGDDIVARVFGSQDFRDAVQAFATKSRVQWKGR
jgi:enoyl-CoA hydratase/carnithine racemase